MTPWLWGFIGLVVLSLLVAARDGDRHLDPVSRKQAADEQRVWDAQNASNE